MYGSNKILVGLFNVKQVVRFEETHATKPRVQVGDHDRVFNRMTNYWMRSSEIWGIIKADV